MRWQWQPGWDDEREQRRPRTSHAGMLPLRSGGCPRLPARRQATRAKAMPAATPLDTARATALATREAMAECLCPFLPCRACVVYGLSPGWRPEPHPPPGHVLQESEGVCHAAGRYVSIPKTDAAPASTFFPRESVCLARSGTGAPDCRTHTRDSHSATRGERDIDTAKLKAGGALTEAGDCPPSKGSGKRCTRLPYCTVKSNTP